MSKVTLNTKDLIGYIPDIELLEVLPRKKKKALKKKIGKQIEKALNLQIEQIRKENKDM